MIFIFPVQPANGSLMENLTGNAPVVKSGILFLLLRAVPAVEKFGRKRSALNMPEVVMHTGHMLTGITGLIPSYKN